MSESELRLVVVLVTLPLFHLLSIHAEVLAHEFGHILVAREVGLTPKKIVFSGWLGLYKWKLPCVGPDFTLHLCLFPGSAYAEYGEHGAERVTAGESVVIFGGGPLANMLLVLTILGVHALFGWGLFSQFAGAMMCVSALLLFLMRHRVMRNFFPFAVAVIPAIAVLLAWEFFKMPVAVNVLPLWRILYASFVTSIVFWNMVGMCNLLPLGEDSDGTVLMEETAHQGGRLGTYAAWATRYACGIVFLSLSGVLSVKMLIS